MLLIYSLLRLEILWLTLCQFHNQLEIEVCMDTVLPGVMLGVL